MDIIRTPPSPNTHAIYEYDLTKTPIVKKLIGEYPSIIAARMVMSLIKDMNIRDKPQTRGDKMYTKNYGRNTFIKGWAIEPIVNRE